MNGRKSILLFIMIILLSGCFDSEIEQIPPLFEEVPILGGEQRIVLEDCTWDLQELDEDTSIVVEFKYYVSSDTCQVDGYSINWRNGYTTSGSWDPPLILIAGRRYTIKDNYLKRMWGADVTLDPVITMTAYDLNNYDVIISQVKDTLMLK